MVGKVRPAVVIDPAGTVRVLDGYVLAITAGGSGVSDRFAAMVRWTPDVVPRWIIATSLIRIHPGLSFMAKAQEGHRPAGSDRGAHRRHGRIPRSRASIVARWASPVLIRRATPLRGRKSGFALERSYRRHPAPGHAAFDYR